MNKDVCDVLLVKDQRDHITKHVNTIKRELEKVKPKLRVKVIGICDIDNKKHVIRCDKVVFLIGEETRSIDSKIPAWIQALNAKHNISKKNAIVVYLTAKTQAHVPNVHNEVTYKLISVSNLDETLLWWPCVLKIVFSRWRRQNTHSIFLDVCVSDDDTQSDIDKIGQVKHQLEDICKHFGIALTEKTADEPTTIQIAIGSSSGPFASKYELLRRCKLNDIISLVFLTSYKNVRQDLRKSTTHQFCPNEFITGVLLILKFAGVLGLTQAKTEIPFRNIKVNRTPTESNDGCINLKSSWKPKRTPNTERFDYISIQLRSADKLKWFDVGSDLPNTDKELRVYNIESLVDHAPGDNFKFQVKVTAECNDGRVIPPLVSGWTRTVPIREKCLKAVHRVPFKTILLIIGACICLPYTLIVFVINTVALCAGLFYQCFTFLCNKFLEQCTDIKERVRVKEFFLIIGAFLCLPYALVVFVINTVALCAGLFYQCFTYLCNKYLEQCLDTKDRVRVKEFFLTIGAFFCLPYALVVFVINTVALCAGLFFQCFTIVLNKLVEQCSVIKGRIPFKGIFIIFVGIIFCPITIVALLLWYCKCHSDPNSGKSGEIFPGHCNLFWEELDKIPLKSVGAVLFAIIFFPITIVVLLVWCFKCKYDHPDSSEWCPGHCYSFWEELENILLKIVGLVVAIKDLPFKGILIIIVGIIFYPITLVVLLVWYCKCHSDDPNSGESGEIFPGHCYSFWEELDKIPLKRVGAVLVAIILFPITIVVLLVWCCKCKYDYPGSSKCCPVHCDSFWEELENIL